jgi:ribosomal protein S18 acetylase RimI-like enzyme
MEYRLTKKTDISHLFTLWNEAGLPIALDGVERETNECEMMLDMNPTSCFVCVENGIILGSIFGTFNGRRAWIYHLAVHPDHQRKGIGGKLYDLAEAALKKRGATKIIVGVLKQNTCVPFYHDRGFELMDDAYLYAKDLGHLKNKH